MTDPTAKKPTPPCPFRALLEEGPAGRVDLFELFAHLAVGCSECLPRVPPALLRALGFTESARCSGLFSSRAGQAAACRLTDEEVDRWFAHRSRAEAPEALAAILALPPQARLYRLLTDEAMRGPEAVSGLGRCLDGLVLSRPPDASALAQAALVFAAAAPPEALPRPLGEDLYLRALRASAEAALRRGDPAAAEHYAGRLVRLWDSCADPYEVAEIANTYALFEVHRGALGDAAALLIEAAREIEEAGDPRFSGHLLTNAARVALLDGRPTAAGHLAGSARERLASAGAEPALLENARRVLDLSAGTEPCSTAEAGAPEQAFFLLVRPISETTH